MITIVENMKCLYKYDDIIVGETKNYITYFMVGWYTFLSGRNGCKKKKKLFTKYEHLCSHILSYQCLINIKAIRCAVYDTIDQT